MIQTAKFFSSVSLLALCINAYTFPAIHQQWYLGTLAGFGTTNWSKITTTDITLQNSLPSHAKDTGLTWGILIGDNINQHYGIEFRYQHYKNSAISFADYNEYAPPPYANNAFTMISKSYNIALLGKLQAQPKSYLNIYSLIGLSYTHRSDRLANIGGLGGFFGAGFTFSICKQWALGPEFDFVTGNEKVTLYPSETYLPFLTSLSVKLIYKL